MRAVWKFELRPPADATGLQVVDMPERAELLTAGLDGLGVPCVWALVDPDGPVSGRRLCVLMTGQAVPGLQASGLTYVGSFVKPEPGLPAVIGHVFEARS
ncbi:MAG: hypothetical protein JWM89_1833 [Acidimicrobiales bacterium]|nr:hypothetical protein [Acidimicrobiales bacterium]